MGYVMKKSSLLLLSSLLGLGISGSAMAVDIARVISATPVFQQVAVPHQVCTDQQVAVQQPKSGAGAVVGAIVGGALGNAAGGHGAGRAAATVLGAVGGSVVGDRIEGSSEPELRTVRQCSTQTSYENRAVAYNVVYEFGGSQYSVQMPNDPGPTIAVQVSPAGSLQSPSSFVVQAPPAPPVTSYVTVQAAPFFYPSPLSPFGYYGHGHWHGREHRNW